MEYKVLCYIEVSGLVEAVNSDIKKGWLPQGGVSYARTDGISNYHMQAMIKT
ncbi:DUF1737 domain-containing protein [Winogradskyella sp. J14-2]|uniref:DUF1737 domain-containing protein n=1 Tax=Winogradskyella sp. J14-2 TaxID=1936080 RepID=UPI0009F9FEA5|nr:DUF1737 domain-containing protein [Winogradskyella sp. J14-2]